MFRVLVAPEFEISAADPDFPRDLLETLKTAREVVDCKYVSFWAQMTDSDLASLIVVSTYPAKWLNRYTEMNYSRIDPTLTKGMQSVAAVIFSHANPGGEDLKAFGADAEAHGIGYSVALVFFGVQCLLLGYLMVKSGYFPKVLGLLLLFAGAGYLTDCFAGFFLPTYDVYADIFAIVVFVPALIGELSLALWLLIKGVKLPQTDAVPSRRPVQEMAAAGSS